MSESIAWSEQFLSALEPEIRARFEPIADLSPRIERIYQQGRAAFPLIDLSPVDFIAYIGGRVVPEDDPLEQLDQMRADELYLACGCAFGLRHALEAFDSQYGADINGAVGRAKSQTQSREDLRQRVWEKLFVGDGERPPKITAYGGRGSLRAWVRVTAVRAVLDVVRWGSERRRKVDMEMEMLEALPDGDPDPELDYIRRTHRERLPEAMRAAFDGLSPRQRNLLRQRFLHGLSTDRIAKMYGVHRATAFRWLETARQQLFEQTREIIVAQLHLSGRELESLIGVLRSRLDISVGGLIDNDIETE